MAEKLARPARLAKELLVTATEPELADAGVRHFVVRATASSATTLPAQGFPQASIELVTCSYFGPGMDRTVIYTGQFDRFRVISLLPRQGSDRSDNKMMSGCGREYS
jgi:hypothetical protein